MLDSAKLLEYIDNEIKQWLFCRNNDYGCGKIEVLEELKRFILQEESK